MNIKRLLAASAMSLFPFIAAAASWDLADDYSTAVNSQTNRNWVYGSTLSVGGTFTAMTRSGQSATIHNWTGNESTSYGYFPIVAKFYGVAGADGALTATDGSVVWRVRNGGIMMHPAPSGQAVARWVAPVAGTYSINANFFNADYKTGATTNVYVVKNGVPFYTGTLSGLSSARSYSSADVGISLSANDTIDFVVHNAGSYYADSTGVEAKIRNLSIH